MVIAVALAADDDDLVAHAACIGQAVHPAGIEPGDAGSRAGQNGRGGARGDAAGFRPGDPGDDPAGMGLKLGNIDAVAGGSPHRLGHLGRHDAAAETGHRAIGVDQRLDAEAFIDIGHGTPVARGSPGEWIVASGDNGGKSLGQPL